VYGKYNLSRRDAPSTPRQGVKIVQRSQYSLTESYPKLNKMVAIPRFKEKREKGIRESDIYNNNVMINVNVINPVLNV
jgi:hypothetical protein